MDEIRRLLGARLAGLRGDLGDVRRILNDGVLQLQQAFQGMTEQIAARDRLLEEILASLAPGEAGEGGQRGLASFAAEATRVLATFAERSTLSAREMLDHLQAVNSTLAEVSSVVGGIEALATQTRFLSLNAAIEAARAGDRYPAFAAIAEQVERVSGETARLNQGIGHGIARTRESLTHVSRSATQVSAEFEQHAAGHVEALQSRAEELQKFLDARAGAAAEMRRRMAVSVTALQLDDVAGQMLARLEHDIEELEPLLPRLLAAAAGSGQNGKDRLDLTGLRSALEPSAGRGPTAAPASARKPEFRAGTVELF